MTRPPIEAVLFDTFGTVVDWRTGVAAAFEEFGALRGVHLDPQELALQWRAKYQPAMGTVRSGERGFVPLDQLHLENLLDVFTENGISIDRIDPATITWLNHSWHRLKGWPDSVPGLTQLKRLVTIGPLSNGNLSLLTEMARYAGLPWDVVLGSDVLQAYKPDPQAYRRAAQLLDLAPEQVMLCAAHNDDLAAAQQSGYRTAFLPRPSEYGPGQRSNLTPTGEWDFVVSSIVELAESFGAAQVPSQTGPSRWEVAATV